jgi:bifunctional oligoribonuclease and PAP phosphatase NrnA
MNDDLRAVAEALRSHDRFLIVTHENPDGDALGSLVAMRLGLDRLGKDSVSFLPGESGVPSDLSLLDLSGVERELPGDAADRVLLALDCANAARMGAAADLLGRVPLSIDVDHHHDNTRFGQINLVLADVSSTGEIVANILRELGVELTREIAEPIYVALMTDTGRFGYTNTTPEAHDLAADLLRAGVDPRRVFQQVYEHVALAHLKLLGRAAERAAVYEGGRLIISYLVRSDFEDLAVGEEYAEGIIDGLRAVDGTEMAAMIREPPEPPGSPRRVSLRASHDEIDVSAIARKRAGGGHRPAAGFSTEESIDEIVQFLRREFVEATSAPAGA